MIYECQVCFGKFGSTDQTRSQQRDGICPSCGYEDIVAPQVIDLSHCGTGAEAKRELAKEVMRL